MGISQKTRKLLWARSGNTCAFPGCPQELTLGKDTIDSIVIGVEAHIVARVADGPRGSQSAPWCDIDGVANLLLLCPTHHRVVDAQPDIFSVKALRFIKETHEREIRKTHRVDLHLPPGLTSDITSDITIEHEVLGVWRVGDSALSVSLMGSEPSMVAENTWIGAGLIFRATDPSIGVVEIGAYSEADPDVCFSVEGSILTITEYIIEPMGLELVPFLKKTYDLTRLDQGVKSTRLFTPEFMDSISAEQAIQMYNEELSHGTDREMAIFSLRRVGWTNVDSVISALELLRQTKHFDGAVAECATAVINELRAYQEAEGGRK